MKCDNCPVQADKICLAEITSLSIYCKNSRRDDVSRMLIRCAKTPQDLAAQQKASRYSATEPIGAAPMVNENDNPDAMTANFASAFLPEATVAARLAICRDSPCPEYRAADDSCAVHCSCGLPLAERARSALRNYCPKGYWIV